MNNRDGFENNGNYDECLKRIKECMARQKELDREHRMIRDTYGSDISYIFKHNVPSHTDNSENCGRKNYTAREIAEVLLGSITY